MQAALSRARPGFELGLDACVFLFLPVLALASRGAAALAAIAGLCALGLVAPEGIAAWRRVRGTALILAVLVGWGLITSLWAVEPERSVHITKPGCSSRRSPLRSFVERGLRLAGAAPGVVRRSS